jgi:hypothetical protein
MPLTHKDLSQLASCTQLCRLHLNSCQLPQNSAATANAESPLAALASLRQLTLEDTRNTLVQGAKQLTSLSIMSDKDTQAELGAMLSGMSNLQQLELSTRASLSSAATLQLVLSNTMHLRSLTLSSSGVDQQGFDTLLAHAPQLTQLTCQYLILTEDRSQSACNLQELVLKCRSESITDMAYLPLHSMERVSFAEYGLQLPAASPGPRFWTYFNSAGEGGMSCQASYKQPWQT